MAFLKPSMKWEVCLLAVLLLCLPDCTKSDGSHLCGGNLDFGQLSLIRESLQKIPYSGHERLVFRNPGSNREMVFLPRQDSLQVLKDFAYSEESFFCGEEVFSVRFSGETARLSFRSAEEYLLNLELRVANVRVDSTSPPVFFDLLSIQLHKPLYGAAGAVQHLYSCFLETMVSLRGQDQLATEIVAQYKNFGFRQELGTHRLGNVEYGSVWAVECERTALYYDEKEGVVSFTDIDGQGWTFDRFEVAGNEFVPNIVLPDSTGVPVGLNDLEEEVVLLVFWASWSLPSRRELVSNLRPLYQDLHEQGVTMYNVSLDTEREAWLRTVAEDQLPGIHVSDLKGTASEVLDGYSLEEIPSIFVLGPGLRILTSGLAGNELRMFVEELLED